MRLQLAANCPIEFPLCCTNKRPKPLFVHALFDIYNSIKFYQRNPGNPAIPGPEVYSFDLTAVPQPIFLYFAIDYQVDVTFPPVALLDGWVSVTRINPGDRCNFIWYGNDASGNGASFDSSTGSWVPTGAALAFCLGGEGIPETPVSNWALIIGVILIGTFVIFRFRRLV